MKIAVCEDEKIFRDRLVTMIEEFYHSIDVIVEEFPSGEALLKRYARGEQLPEYEIVFLDIEMNRIDGLQTAKQIRAYGGKEKIIFVTSHTEFAMQGYEVEAFRFLQKPIQYEKLKETLQELENRKNKEKVMWLHTCEEDVAVQISSIVYIEAMKNDVYFYVLEHKNAVSLTEYKVRKKISEIEQELENEGFFRCHRSYLVRLMEIVSYTNKDIRLKTGQVLPISRGKSSELKASLIRAIGNSSTSNVMMLGSIGWK